MNRIDIRARIDAALEKARWQQIEVRRIYLDQADLDALDAAMTADFGMQIRACTYEGHGVSIGKSSVVYSTHGVGVRVPKRLNAKVAA